MAKMYGCLYQPECIDLFSQGIVKEEHKKNNETPNELSDHLNDDRMKD